MLCFMLLMSRANGPPELLFDVRPGSLFKLVAKQGDPGCNHPDDGHENGDCGLPQFRPGDLLSPWDMGGTDGQKAAVAPRAVAAKGVFD